MEKRNKISYEFDSDSDSTIADVEVINSYQSYVDKETPSTSTFSNILSNTNYKQCSDELDLILRKYGDPSPSTATLPTTTTENNELDAPIELSSDEELPLIDQNLCTSTNSALYQGFQNTLHSFTNTNETETMSNEAEYNCSPPKKKRYGSNVEYDKEKRKQEKAAQKLQKQEQLAKEKKLKQALLSAKKSIKPEECLKFITVEIDEEVVKESYGEEILNSLGTIESTYTVKAQLLPNIVTWTHKVFSQNVKDNELIENIELVETDNVLEIITWDQIVKLIHDKTLNSHVESIKSLLNKKKLFMVVYGLENYFRYNKRQRQREMRNEVLQNVTNTTDKHDQMFRNVVKIDKKQFEVAFTELQILHSCCYRLIDNPQELGAMLVQFTKSIASVPYKLEKYEKQVQADWYMAGDNKDCVKVDKNGNGLKRLWQQQLITFPLTRLEHAEAIISKYPTMKSLLQEYSSLTQDQGEKVLQEIPIRRAAGPLTTVRRLGIELSKKVYKHFSSVNGNLTL